MSTGPRQCMWTVALQPQACSSCQAARRSKACVSRAGLFPDGAPHLQQPAVLAKLLPRVTFEPAGVCAFPAHPETYGQAKRRCSRTALALAERHRGQNILLVGHGLSVEYLVGPTLLPAQHHSCDLSARASCTSCTVGDRCTLVRQAPTLLMVGARRPPAWSRARGAARRYPTAA